ncbi:MAG: S41 family peptidase [Candidatus Eisenbacteria bacterium]
MASCSGMWFSAGRVRIALALALGAAWMSVSSECRAARVDRTPVLGFESVGGEPPLWGWVGNPRGPEGTVFLDSTTVHSGRYSGLLERTKDSPTTFSSFACIVPRDFAGDTLELRGWLKLDGVEGIAGLWQRQESASGVERFDNMQARNLHGTSDWTEYRVALPLSPKVRKVTVGALLSGTGRVWVDDLRLYANGKPISEAAEFVPPKTITDIDTEFVADSKLTLTKPTAAQIDDLVLLGKVWGFLKYHHPAAVRGQRNWDAELFRVAPAVLRAKDRAAAQRAILAWLSGLGPVPPCSVCVTRDSGAVLQPRLAWLDDRVLLSDALAQRLHGVYVNRPDTSEQFYVQLASNLRNPVFLGEVGYAGQGTLDPGYRLLALYRFWNIIEYWSPYRDLAEHDWDGTLREFVPRLLAAGTREDYQRACIALIARVHDSHANLWSGLAARPPAGKAWLPFSVRFLKDQAVVSGYTNPQLGPASGVRVGDVIESIDGVPVSTLVERWRPLYAGSNDAAQRRDMTRDLTRGDPGAVKLVLLRDRTRTEVTASRVTQESLDRTAEWQHDHAGPTLRRLSDDIVYLKLSSVKAAETPEYLKAMADAKCVLIDLRNYPSEFMVFALGQHLVREPTPFVGFTFGSTRNPGTFLKGEPLRLSPQAPYVDAPVAILVDEVTQSQAEYTTMAFRVHPGAVVVGSQTAGADGNVSPFTLPGEQRTMISGLGVFYPDGRPTQRIGIVPDLEVHATPAGLRDGRDEVLEAAVRRVLGRELTSAERDALDPGGVWRR